MKWLALVVLWAAAACGESVLVATEIVSDTNAAPGECTGESAESTAAELAPAVFELVIDTSGTMGDSLPDERGSKWTVTRDALLDAIEAMPEQTSLGVVFYPDVPNGPVCFDRNVDVPIDALGRAGSDQRRRIEAAFEGQSPEGGAPTHDAYNFAFDQLRDSEASGRRFMLLIADDYPTFEIGCRSEGPIDSDPLIGQTGFAQTSGVSTFVVGLPGGEEAKRTLSRMALAGGTAPEGCSHLGPDYCHFDMTDEQEFAEGMARTLEDITAEALSCTYAVPMAISGTSPDPEQLQVSLAPEDGSASALQRQAAGACDEGWRYSPDGSTVVLCEGTCARVREGKGRIELRTGCAQSP
jgi:hypothetical protein